MTNDAAVRAAKLVGTRFRQQGRSAANGLDCLGLVLLSHRLASAEAPNDYRLRGEHRDAFLSKAERWFRKIPGRSGKPGDVLAMAPAKDQLHLGILTANGFIHADAKLGRVVETPGAPVWPVIATLRRRSRARKVTC